MTDLAALVPDPPSRPTNGYSPLPPVDDEAAEAIAPSPYLRFLPAIYGADEFVGRFLRIFEDVLDPISIMVDNQPYYFDPMVAPPELLDWMAMWVDVQEGEEWPLPRRRALIAAAAAIYRMRGTPTGLKQHVGIYTGGVPLIMENTNGFRLLPDARLGLNTVIGELRPRIFTVTIAVPHPEELDMETLQSILDADKPVETAYILRVIRLEPKAADTTVITKRR